MSGLAELVFNIELSLTVAIVTSLVLGALLLLINVPDTEYSRRLIRTRNAIAMCFIICAALFYYCYRHSGMLDFETFSSIMMFVVTAISSVILSYSLINLLRKGDTDRLYINTGVISVLCVVLIKSFWWEDGWLKTTVKLVAVVLFIFQCISHIVAFRRIYFSSIKKMEQYYDEEQDQRLKWIRFCYTIMMLTQMFILVYMILPRGFMKVYNVWYMLFMLYFAANFISFLGSHKLLLDAFAYKALSGQDKILPIKRKRKPKVKVEAEVAEKVTPAAEAEIKKLERALDKWVKQKKFCEYDKSRGDVVKELDTTKEILHMYFSTYVGKDFKTWRTELRIEEAKRLLVDNKDMSTNVIGEIAGFSDRSNFHRQFVKIVGCTPKQWRDSGGAGCA